MKADFRISVDHNLQESTVHGSYAFPMETYLDELAKMENGTVQWHWHNEIELVIGVHGSGDFHIRDSMVHLQAGEGLFINANELHMVDQQPPYNSVFRSAVVDPMLICGHNETSIAHKYVEPILSCTQLPYLHLQPNIPWHRQLIEHLNTMFRVHQYKDFGYELLMRNELSAFWHTLLLHTQAVTTAPGFDQVSPDNIRIKMMMQYIQSNYAQPVSLSGIASAADISVSECCRCFGRVLDMTPFEYLLQYRLNQASKLLVESGQPVTEIAHRVGFDTLSYFGKKFKEAYGCTPSQYRKKAVSRI